MICTTRRADAGRWRAPEVPMGHFGPVAKFGLRERWLDLVAPGWQALDEINLLNKPGVDGTVLLPNKERIYFTRKTYTKFPAVVVHLYHGDLPGPFYTFTGDWLYAEFTNNGGEVYGFPWKPLKEKLAARAEIIVAKRRMANTKFQTDPCVCLDAEPLLPAIPGAFHIRYADAISV